jgi:NADH dehydrogenase
MTLLAARLIGRILGDITLTRDEVDGLSSGLLVSKNGPTCPTCISTWLKENSNRIGETYSSELARREASKRR